MAINGRMQAMTDQKKIPQLVLYLVAETQCVLDYTTILEDPTDIDCHGQTKLMIVSLQVIQLVRVDSIHRIVDQVRKPSIVGPLAGMPDRIDQRLDK